MQNPSLNRMGWPILFGSLFMVFLAGLIRPNIAANNPNQPFTNSISISLVPFATGLSTPVDIANAGDDRLFIALQPGLIKIVDSNGSVLPTPFLDISDRILEGGERGLLGLAFHPDYPGNSTLYVNYTRDSPNSTEVGDTVISRFSISGNPDIADPNSEEVLLVVEQDFPNHNGGDLNFGPDGYLYIGLGDGGSGGDPNNRAQTYSNLLGSILRIDVDGNGKSPDCGVGNYTVPGDNPFTGVPGACDEIWATGLRNPWRFSFDSLTGDIFIADVGQGNWEEINFQPASSKGGENWGWRCYEGTHSFNTNGCGPVNQYDFPFFEYDHSVGCSVTGGFVYRGNQFPAMDGHYLFADYCSGNFWSAKDDPGLGWDVTFLGGFGSAVTTFGLGFDRELYVASGSTIYQIVENSPPMTPTPLPTESVSLEVFATGFDEPVDLGHAGNDRIFIAERDGLIQQVQKDGTIVSDPFLAISDRVGTTGWQQGLLSFAFHPDYSNNGYLYVNYTDHFSNTIISRFTYSNSLQTIDPSSEYILLKVDQPFADNNGSDLVFGPDGFLYIAMGDGGGSGAFNTTAQDPSSLLGKILRINVDGNGLPSDCGMVGNYTIPVDNPFVGDLNRCDEIWALGLRHPWRISFDRETADLYIADVGEDTIEEINLQVSTSPGGENYGWSCLEGSQAGPNPANCTSGYTFPIHEYTHDFGDSIIGGYVYRGCQYSGLVGNYFFADFVTGNLWSITSDDTGNWQSKPWLQGGGSFSSFGEAVDGELFLVDYSGTVYHITGSSPPTIACLPIKNFLPLIESHFKH